MHGQNSLKVLMVLFAIVICIILYEFNPLQYAFMPKCPFKLLTGLQCGGCGFQRCVHSLLHGDFEKALQYNYFLAYALPYVFLLITAKYFLRNNMTRLLTIVLEHRYSVYFYVITYIGWTILRNIINI